MVIIKDYTWSSTLYCRRAKQLPSQKGVICTEYEFDDDEAARDAMVARPTNAQRTVQWIFISGLHVDSSDDLNQWKQSGILNDLLGCNEVHS